MKKILFLLLITFSVSGLFAQDNNNEVKEEATFLKPNSGKCMVYIARREAGAFLIKFGIYDGDLFLGKLGPSRYFAYECDPGEHVFIAKGENTFYVDANLEEGKTYVMDIRLKPGIATSRVALAPLDKTQKKFEKERTKFLKFINTKKGELLIGNEKPKDDDLDAEDSDTESSEATEKHQSKRMRKFYEMKQKGKKITVLNPDMYFE